MSEPCPAGYSGYIYGGYHCLQTTPTSSAPFKNLGGENQDTKIRQDCANIQEILLTTQQVTNIKLKMIIWAQGLSS